MFYSAMLFAFVFSIKKGNARNPSSKYRGCTTLSWITSYVSACTCSMHSKRTQMGASTSFGSTICFLLCILKVSDSLKFPKQTKKQNQNKNKTNNPTQTKIKKVGHMSCIKSAQSQASQYSREFKEHKHRSVWILKV